jgi:hypothetical protein
MTRPGNSRRAGVALLATLLAACAGERLAITAFEAPGAGPSAGDVAVGRAPDSGDLYLAWVAGDSGARHVWFSRGGTEERWSEPVQVTDVADDVGAPHGESSPRVVAGGGDRVALVWSRSVPVPGRRWPASEIRFARSLDGGATWSAPRTLNDDSTGAPGTHTFHGAAWLGGDSIVAAWLDERGGESFPGHHHAADDAAAMPTTESDARIFVTTSEDFGATWSPNRAVWGEVCPCCRVSLARDPSGTLVAAWRKHFPGSIRDVVTAPLLPAAGEPERVHQDDWEYPGCPHTGPALAIDSSGARHVAWYTGKPGGAGMFYRRIAPGPGGASSATPLVTGAGLQTGHAAIAATGSGAIVAFDVDADGARAIRVARVDATGAVAGIETIEGSLGGTYPQLVALGSHDALVAWRRAGTDAGLGLARVSWK